MSSADARLWELWRPEPGTLGWLGSVDHKEIGKRYLVTATAFLVVGGIEALLMRWQLTSPEQRVLGSEGYDRLFTLHGMTMIFWYASPILSGFGNYLVPLLIGARDMAFPRLNAFSYWTFLLSGLLLYGGAALGETPHAGWFAYVPYTESTFSPGRGMDFYAVSLLFLTISTTVGAINFIVTILRLRAPGMTFARTPLLMYSTFTTSVSVVFALPALTAACLFLELDRRWHFHFFDAANGGDPLLWQQLFWFFGHPWVYIVFLPATGMISMLLPVFARRPIVGYPYVAFATVLTGLVGFGVWIHHMFAVGMSHMSMNFFAAASMTISVFSAVQVFAWLATLWLGRPVLTASMLFALGFVASLVIGGLSGVVTAVVPFDWQVHDTYFVVAHLHYVLVGANVFPVFAAFYYWLPKITGRCLDERLGRTSFWLMLVGFNVTFFPMHAAGALGMRRRVFTFAADQGLNGLNALATIGALVLTLGVLVSVVNLVRSLLGGRVAGNDPWRADTLEWSLSSPPAPFNTPRVPTVVTRHPLWDGHAELADPGASRALDEGRVALITSIVDAEPRSLAKMPEDTTLPLLAALALLAASLGVLAKSVWILGLSALVTAAVAAAWLWPRAEKHPSSPPDEDRPPSPFVRADDPRGADGMRLFVLSEATLFVMLFFSFFYLGGAKPLVKPELRLALAMLAVLLASSVAVGFGERWSRRGRFTHARGLVGLAMVLGVVFIGLQALEYSHQLRVLRPQSSAYGSIFYTLTSVHGVHVLLGLLILGYALVMPRGNLPDAPRGRALHNAAMYWHFVDVVWVFIVGFVYLLPRITGG